MLKSQSTKVTLIGVECRWKGKFPTFIVVSRIYFNLNLLQHMNLGKKKAPKVYTFLKKPFGHLDFFLVICGSKLMKLFSWGAKWCLHLHAKFHQVY